MQYIYKVLGTPKPMGFTDFDALPLAALYGRHLQVANTRCDAVELFLSLWKQ